MTPFRWLSLKWVTQRSLMKYKRWMLSFFSMEKITKVKFKITEIQFVFYLIHDSVYLLLCKHDLCIFLHLNVLFKWRKNTKVKLQFIRLQSKTLSYIDWIKWKTSVFSSIMACSMEKKKQLNSGLKYFKTTFFFYSSKKSKWRILLRSSFKLYEKNWLNQKEGILVISSIINYFMEKNRSSHALNISK